MKTTNLKMIFVITALIVVTLSAIIVSGIASEKDASKEVQSAEEEVIDTTYTSEMIEDFNSVEPTEIEITNTETETEITGKEDAISEEVFEEEHAVPVKPTTPSKPDISVKPVVTVESKVIVKFLPDSNGTVHPTCVQVKKGTPQSEITKLVKVKPAAGYQFSKWEVQSNGSVFKAIFTPMKTYPELPEVFYIFDDHSETMIAELTPYKNSSSASKSMNEAFNKLDDEVLKDLNILYFFDYDFKAADPDGAMPEGNTATTYFELPDVKESESVRLFSYVKGEWVERYPYNAPVGAPYFPFFDMTRGSTVIATGKPLPTVSFNIEFDDNTTKTFSGVEGMTVGEWVYSTYNTDYFGSWLNSDGERYLSHDYTGGDVTVTSKLTERISSGCTLKVKGSLILNITVIYGDKIVNRLDNMQARKGVTVSEWISRGNATPYLYEYPISVGENNRVCAFECYGSDPRSTPVSTALYEDTTLYSLGMFDNDEQVNVPIVRPELISATGNEDIKFLSFPEATRTLTYDEQERLVEIKLEDYEELLERHGYPDAVFDAVSESKDKATVTFSIETLDVIVESIKLYCWDGVKWHNVEIKRNSDGIFTAVHLIPGILALYLNP